MALGWRLANEQQAAREPLPLPSVVQIPQADYDQAGVAITRMPDVRGLNQATAEQVLADAGVKVATVGFEPVPWAGTPGQVVEQSPVAGTENPADIRITVSKQAIVPGIKGRTAAEVTAELSALGVEVLYTSQYRAGAAGGSVLGIDPAPGKALPDRVTLTVAQTPGSVMLSTISAINGGGQTGSVDLDGTSYPSSTVFDAYTEAADHEWLISRVVDSVEGTVGIPDTSDPDASAKVEVLADGTLVERLTVRYGKTVTMRATVTGALRLSFRITSTSPDEDTTDVAFGDVKLIGGADALKKLGTP